MSEAPAPHAEPIDWHELDRAWRLLRSAGERFDWIAAEEGWPTPFGPIRYLILARLSEATAYGLSARRLVRALSVSRSTMAYHLDALEGAGLVHRVPWTVYDRRKVAVRLTEAGRYAVRRLAASRYEPAMSSPAMASP